MHQRYITRLPVDDQYGMSIKLRQCVCVHTDDFVKFLFCVFILYTFNVKDFLVDQVVMFLSHLSRINANFHIQE